MVCGNRQSTIYGDSLREVGRKLPNGFGLYDMGGGMEEWMSDGWGTCSSYSATDPYCPITNGFRMIKGGDWAAQAWELGILFRPIMMRVVDTAPVDLGLVSPINLDAAH